MLGALVALVALAGASWAWWDRRRRDPWQRLEQRVRERLALLGVTVAPQHPLRERAARVRAALGTPGEALAQALEALERARYRDAGHGAPMGRRELARWWGTIADAARRAGGAAPGRAAPAAPEKISHPAS